MTVLAAIMAFALPALSEEKAVDELQNSIKKMRVDKKLFFAEKMKLTESEAKAFWPIYESYQDELFDIGDRLIKGIREYADKYGNISDEDSKKLRREYLAILFDTLRLQESYLPKFEAVLPEKKVARWFRLERSFEGELEAMLGRIIPFRQ
jgi:predicted phosphohydrolase